MPSATQRYALYRFYDRAGELLYVDTAGALASAPAEVDHVTVERFEFRQDLLAAEMDALRTELPAALAHAYSGEVPF